MNIQTLLGGILNFLSSTIIPFLLAIAGLVFFWNIARFFIIGGDNTESQEKARSHALWGIIAFVIILSLWGIVNMFVNGFGFDRNGAITPDYICDKTGGNCTDKRAPVAPPPAQKTVPDQRPPGYFET